METITSSNISSWAASPDAKNAPPLDEVVASRADGLPVPRFAGKTIHSSYNPREESRRLVDEFCQRNGVEKGDRVAVLGNGFGYAAEALLDRGVRPVAFEPSRSLLRGFAESRDAAAFLARVPLFLIDSAADLYRSGEHRALLPGIKAVLPLPYVSWLYPELPGRFGAALDAIRAAEGRYFRVSVVTPLFGGSLEIARYAANGLMANGHLVDYVDVSGFGGVLKGMGPFHEKLGPARRSANLREFTGWCSRLIQERVEAFDPAIVVVLAQAPLDEAQVRAMREQGRRVVYWFVEDFRLFRYWETDAARYDAWFPIQKGAFLRDLALAGQQNAHYLPMAADEKVFFPAPLAPDEEKRFGSPISFMGAGYYNRGRFFNALLSRPFKIWGTDWDWAGPIARHVQEGGRRITSAETAKIFNGTRVNVNLHSSTSHEGVNPFGDFVNPRTFEIAACGAFQLVDHRSLLPELFRVGDEVVGFSGPADFLEKLDRYLADPEARAQVAARGMARVLREHTYKDRMREMVESLGEMCPVEASRRLPTVREMTRAADDPEWDALLSEFPPDLPLDFDLLLEGVRKMSQDRPFTKKETIISMLGNLRHGGI